MKEEKFDLVIVGGGPCGLACGIEASRAGMDYLILEKGAITEAIRRFPTNMRFFSTPELLELGGVPFPSFDQHPTRTEALEYYRKLVDYFKLNIQLRSEVSCVEKSGGNFLVHLANDRIICAKRVVLAIGYFDFPKLINVPGENLPHVFHYYDEPYKYVRSKVLIVGAKNSAVDTALELYRHGADVTLVHRGDSFGSSVKYWIRPDIENRIKEGSIKAYFNTEVKEIRSNEVDLHIKESNQDVTLKADFVFLMTGYHPDTDFIRKCDVQVDPLTLTPVHDPETFETNIPGLFVAGSAACGCEISNIFIENGRFHAEQIIAHLRSLEE